MNDKKVKLYCSKCGHKVEVFENEAMDFAECCLCGGAMLFDMLKKETEPIGDNFPVIDKEREMRDSISSLGNNHTWYLIEAIADVKLRLDYRKTFFACNGVVPEGQEII